MAVPARKNASPSLKDLIDKGEDKKDDTTSEPIVEETTVVEDDNKPDVDGPLDMPEPEDTPVVPDVDDDGKSGNVVIVDSDPESDNNDPIVQRAPGTGEVIVSEDGEHGPYAKPDKNLNHIWGENHEQNLGKLHPDVVQTTHASDKAHVIRTNVSETVYAGENAYDDKGRALAPNVDAEFLDVNDNTSDLRD